MKRIVSLLVATGALMGGWPALSAGSAREDELADVVARFGKTRWTSNNRIELLADPRRAWEARLDLLESAESHLFLSTFSWYNDDYGNRFRRALADVVRLRSREGGDFQLRCLADATAVGLFNRSFDELRENGADVRSFNRSTWGMSAIYDGRMHDKILVADGRRAIVGGRNYSDIYYDPMNWWLDFGVLIEGSAVWDLQMIFLKSWEVSNDLGWAQHFGLSVEAVRSRIRSLWATGRFPGGRSPLEQYFNERYFPDILEPPGDTRVAVLYDNSIVWDRAPTSVMLVNLVNIATSEIDLMTPFPNLDNELTEALIGAIRRGVRVRLVVNDRSAALRGGPILQSSYPTLIRLVDEGAEIYGWKANPKLLADVTATACAPRIMPPVALHGKVVRIDDALTIVHSSNFNIRSTYYNTEAGVAVLDRGFNRRLENLIDGLITLSDFELRCTNGNRQVVVDALVNRLDKDDVEAMRLELGGRQRFLDGMSLLW
jgi:phosphatidylserine/phosphatidylglycerophosphate/cardiolipin synthase-like enzyme